jgi:hypothetical protein
MAGKVALAPAKRRGGAIASCFAPRPLPAADPMSSLSLSCPLLLRQVGLQGRGGDDAVDVNPRGKGSNDTTISPP